ncbi:MAG: hypothetical protein REJ24_21685, partial [Rhodocyclaceae bacterium]|nr:hypothetical protein [Pseudomonadota bacterium]MDQ7975204.1 hypothetical protein [Rhodocyclaceae bacterium]MDQ8002633.1 hypothetical protein [Pseudomonadota bacterium]
MTEAAKPFAFSQLVPGFDFLKSLTGAAASGTVPGLPSLSNWVAPTLSVEELDKRINELKTVQYWLEQNVHALKATIQALEVQKMTLSTLRGMNVRMEDLANAFTRSTASAAAAVRDAAAPASPTAAPAPEPEVEDEQVEDEDAPPVGPAPAAAGTPKGKSAAAAADKPAGDAPGVIDPLQWWNSLTQQFQQIASNALQDASQLKMPGMPPQGAAPPAKPGAKAPAPKKKAAAAKAPARKAPAKKAAAAKRPASRTRG